MYIFIPLTYPTRNLSIYYGLEPVVSVVYPDPDIIGNYK